MTLERAANLANSDLDSFEPVQFSWMHRPMTLRSVLKRTTPHHVVQVLVGLFEHMSRKCVGEKKWQEALVLAQFSELPPTLWWAGQPLGRSEASQLVKAAFHAPSGRDMAEYLERLAYLASSSEDLFSFAVAYDYCRILLKQSRYREVETTITSKLNQLLKQPKFSLATQEGTSYVWIIKALGLAFVGQGQTAEAQRVLLKAYSTITDLSEDDTLSLLHIEMLFVSFHRKWGMDLPSPIDKYEKSLFDRFKRMYAANGAQLLKAEGLGMAIVLLGQGALEEAVMVIQMFINASSATFGEKHELTLRATRYHCVALSEMEQEKGNECNGDFWLHFGSAVFQRDASRLDSDSGGGGSLKFPTQPDLVKSSSSIVVSWVTEENCKPQGIRDKLEIMLSDVGLLPLSLYSRWMMIGSSTLSSLVALIFLLGRRYRSFRGR